MRSTLYAISRFIFISLGAFLVALATNSILVPHDLLAGGLTGFATFFYYLFNWKISTLVILFNIPIFLIGFILLRKNFIFTSFFGLIVFTLFLRLTENYVLPIDEPLAVILMAGILTGIGCGIIYRLDASLGGGDIIAKIVNHYFSLNMATVTLLINSVIIVCSISLFGIDLAMLTLSTMFLSSKITNFVVDGINYKRTLCITTTTKHASYIAQHISEALHHPVTLLQGTLTNLKQPCSIIQTTVALSEVGKVKRLVKSHDPLAFISLTSTALIIAPPKEFSEPNT